MMINDLVEFRQGMYVVNKITKAIFKVIDSNPNRPEYIEVFDLRQNISASRPKMNFRPLAIQTGDEVRAGKDIVYRINSIYWEGQYHNDYFCTAGTTYNKSAPGAVLRVRVFVQEIKEFV